jgi:hypothetical protein
MILNEHHQTKYSGQTNQTNNEIHINSPSRMCHQASSDPYGP